MKKQQLTVRLAAILLVLVMALVSLTGCQLEQPVESTENTEYFTAYEGYVQSVLDANYHAEYEEYMAITGATAEQASKILQAHAVTLTEQLAEMYDIHLGQLPEEIGNRLVEICTAIYKKSAYSVESVEKVGETVYVTVSVEPIKFLEDAASGVSDFTAAFNDRAKAGEFENMTESEYEYEYAKGILDVLEDAVDGITYAEAKTYRIQIQYNAETGVNYIGEDDLNAINQLILAE